jgi:hypothetical protein
MTRWKITPEYRGALDCSFVRGSVQVFSPVARPTKFETVSGACSAKSSRRMSPRLVCSVASMTAIVARVLRTAV